jgi:hypothetical protein
MQFKIWGQGNVYAQIGEELFADCLTCFSPFFITDYEPCHHKYWLLGGGQVAACAASFVNVEEMH